MYKFVDLIQRTILRLSQQTGTSVQIYSEDVIAEMMQHKFNVVFEDRWWEDYSLWGKSTLTANGVVQDNLSDPAIGIKRYTDIEHIFFNSDSRPLPRVPAATNPARFDGGGRPYYHEPWGENGKFFRVLPYGDTRDVSYRYRKRPDPFEPEDLVKIDDEIFILGTAYDYLEDDGSNPGATAKFLQWFNDRYEQLLGSANNAPVPIGDGYPASGEPWGIGDRTY